ncbi:MAG: DNA polymerase III subunit beta [Candidatus Melainabacteria bacterium]|nr:DNA polymerase III subunit beta [Candidatus Melainabacteria bacterium]
MKFSVQRDDLYAAVSAVQRATATRVIQPILANILIQSSVDGGTHLTLAATDLDFSVETLIEATIQQPGKTTISAKKLNEILAKLPPKTTVEFSLDENLQMACIQCGQAQFDVRTISADEFPLLPDASGQPALEVGLLALGRAINQTVFAAASQESNNVLGGVFFKLTPSSLEMVATDGSRLARRVETLEGIASTITEEMTAIIPAKALQELLKLLPSHPLEEDRLCLVIQDGQIFFMTDRLKVVSRLLDGQYPRYEQLIPTQHTIVASAKKQELIASLERAAVMANERTNIVKMNLEENTLSLAAQTPDVGDSKDMLTVHYQGEPLNIAFNYRYVLDALKVIESDDVRMETSGPLSPTIFRSGDTASNYICLVMPVQVK